jgi:hypothetical protein
LRKADFYQQLLKGSSRQLNFRAAQDFGYNCSSCGRERVVFFFIAEKLIILAVPAAIYATTPL